MIRRTGINARLSEIPFASELERTVGFALATADLLGQMLKRGSVKTLKRRSVKWAKLGGGSGPATLQ
jgi:hypothetical protein